MVAFKLSEMRTRQNNEKITHAELRKRLKDYFEVDDAGLNEVENNIAKLISVTNQMINSVNFDRIKWTIRREISDLDKEEPSQRKLVATTSRGSNMFYIQFKYTTKGDRHYTEEGKKAYGQLRSHEMQKGIHYTTDAIFYVSVYPLSTDS